MIKLNKKGNPSSSSSASMSADPLMRLDDDSSHSGCSTMTVEAMAPRGPLFTTKAKSATTNQGPKKTVQFCLENNRDDRGAANAKYASQCWYTVEELYMFKKSVAVLAKKIVKSTSSESCKYQRVLTSVFSTCCRAAEMMTDIDSSRHSISGDSIASGKSVLCQGDRMDLVSCLSASPARLGLDRITVSIVRDDSKARKACVVATVLEAQARLRKQAALSPLQVQLAIRKAVEPLNRPYRIFAREVGAVVRLSES